MDANALGHLPVADRPGSLLMRCCSHHQLTFQDAYQGRSYLGDLHQREHALSDQCESLDFCTNRRAERVQRVTPCRIYVRNESAISCPPMVMPGSPPTVRPLMCRSPSSKPLEPSRSSVRRSAGPAPTAPSCPPPSARPQPR